MQLDTRGLLTAVPFYFGAADDLQFGWWHPAAQPSPLAVLLCAPWGDEDLNVHRGLRQLACALAAAGLPTLRFDFAGSGDSLGPGDSAPAGEPDGAVDGEVDRAGDQLPRWLASVGRAADELAARSGAARIAVVGVRLGALLAAQALWSRRDLAALVAWAPLASGRAWLRECRVLGAAMGLPEAGGGGLQAGGFRLGAATCDSLNALTWPATDPAGRLQALVMDRDDRVGGGRCADALRARSVPTLLEAQAGLDALTAVAHSAHTPPALIARTVGWLCELTGELKSELEGERPTSLAGVRPHALTSPQPGAQPERPAAGTAALSIQRAACPDASVADCFWPVGGASGSGVGERLVHIGREPSLFGVLTQGGTSPAVAADGGRRGLLLLSSGGERRIGPHRLWVDFARQRAQRGDCVLRLDLAGIGDSETRPGGREHDIYDDRCVSDIASALAWLREHCGVGPCAVAGLCSGAYHAWRAALARVNLQSVLIVNPLVFHWKPGMSLDPTTHAFGQTTIVDGALRSLRDPQRWRKLMRGQVNLDVILGAAGRHAAGGVRLKARAAARALRLPLQDDLPRELATVAAAGVKLHFVFSEADPGHHVLLAQAGGAVARLRRLGRLDVTTLPGADHTFARPAGRQVLYQQLHRLLDTHNPQVGASPAVPLSLYS